MDEHQRATWKGMCVSHGDAAFPKLPASGLRPMHRSNLGAGEVVAARMKRMSLLLSKAQRPSAAFAKDPASNGKCLFVMALPFIPTLPEDWKAHDRGSVLCSGETF